MADFFGNDSVLGNVGNFFLNTAGVGEKADAINQIQSGDTLGGAANLVNGFSAASSPSLKVLGEVANAIPGAKFVLDLPNRTADTVAMVAQNADRVGWMAAGSPVTGEQDGGAALGALFNADSWNKAWNSWGQETHTTLGQFLANGAAGGPLRYYDPFDAQQSQMVRNTIHDTWGADLFAAATDVAAGFVAPVPGGGLVKASRLAKTLDAASVERVSEVFNADKGTLDSLKATPKADTAKVAVFGEGAANSESVHLSQAAQFRDAIRGTNGIKSESAMADHLGPWMESATEQAKATLASMFAQANRLNDPLMAEHVKGNVMLAAMGSSGAKAELVKTAPLIASQLERVSKAPEEVDLFTKLQQARLSGADYDTGTILEQHFGTAQAQVEINALKGEFSKAKIANQQARDAVLEAKDNVPAAYRNFDSERLAESRSLAAQRVAKIQEQLDSAKKLGTEVEFDAGRAAQLKAQLAEAKADHALLQQTPLKHPGLDDAKGALVDARQAVKDTRNDRDMIQAEIRVRKSALADKRARMAELAPDLNRSNDWLNDIFNLGTEGYIQTGRVAPSRLDAVKTAFRNTVGEEYLYRTADATPNVFVQHIPNGPEVANAIGTPRARGGINLAEVGSKGYRELAESLKRSGVFSGDEIRAAADTLLSTPVGERQLHVSRVETDMLERIAGKYGLTPEQAKKYAGMAQQKYGKGRKFLASALEKDGAGGSDTIWVRGEDGEARVFDKAMLRSHLADTAPFIDPSIYETSLRSGLGKMKTPERLFRNSLELNDALQHVWKHSVLLRPGLAIRTMLDTELRAIALLGAGTQFAAAANGLMRTKASRALQRGAGDALAKIGLNTTPFDRLALESMGHKAFSLDVGAGKTVDVQAYRNAADFTAQRLALTKGQSYAQALMDATSKYHDNLALDRNAWKKYQADAPEWTRVYAEHAGVLLASPTVRRLVDDMRIDHAGPVDLNAYVSDLFKDPNVVAEYNNLALGQGVSKAEFVENLVNEVWTMFPTKEVSDALLSGNLRNKKLSQAFVNKHFPPEERFDIPGPQSVLNPSGIAGMGKKAMDAFYRVAIDQPDFWMARHPVFVKEFQQGLQREAAALLQKRVHEFGPDAELGAKDIDMLTSRARTAATSKVRNTFYDNTRYTGAHAVLTRVSPFLNAWEDAMMSWGRLLYDDPKRIFRLAGAWNAPVNASQWMSEPLLVDGDGKPLRPGEESSNGEYIAVPGTVFGTKLKVNHQALNSIAQGEVAWLPGFGPTSQVATTFVLGDILPKDMVLDLVGTDSFVGKNLLQSMFLGGEVPKAGAEDIIKSAMPSNLRNLYNDTFGSGMAMNASFYANHLYIEALQNGTTVDPNQAIAEGRHQAQVAGLVRLIAGGGLGMTGRATVDGQFYVDQMHQLQALTPDQLKQMGYPDATAAFSAKFPEAANLDWRLTRNETGITASVNAQKGAVANSSLIDKYPSLGWFVVGGDNVGGQFSQTAYNQQVGNTYGLQQLGRKTESVDETLNGSVVGMGWDQYQKFTASLGDVQAEMSLTTDQVSALKQMAVAQIAKWNPSWFQDYSDRANKLATFYNEADLIAQDPSVKDRPDMVAYRDYRQARQQVLDSLGLKSLTGTGTNSALARAYLRNAGEKLVASQPGGFSQMWDRMLSSEVAERPTDKEKLSGY